MSQTLLVGTAHTGLNKINLDSLVRYVFFPCFKLVNSVMIWFVLMPTTKYHVLAPHPFFHVLVW